MFPTYRKEGTYPHDLKPIGGMALRDHFAGLAMAAIIAKSAFQSNPQDYEVYKKTTIGAYDYADAMLAARAEVPHG